MNHFDDTIWRSVETHWKKHLLREKQVKFPTSFYEYFYVHTHTEKPLTQNFPPSKIISSQGVSNILPMYLNLQTMV